MIALVFNAAPLKNTVFDKRLKVCERYCIYLFGKHFVLSPPSGIESCYELHPVCIQIGCPSAHDSSH